MPGTVLGGRHTFVNKKDPWPGGAYILETGDRRYIKHLKQENWTGHLQPFGSDFFF